MQKTDKVKAQIHSLDPEEIAEIYKSLLFQEGDAPEISEKERAELHKIKADIESGKAKTHSKDEVFNRLDSFIKSLA